MSNTEVSREAYAKKQVNCRYYKQDRKCKNGSQCPYMHVERQMLNRPMKEQTAKHKQKVCVGYKKNECKYGAMCRFLHDSGNQPYSEAHENEASAVPVMKQTEDANENVNTYSDDILRKRKKCRQFVSLQGCGKGDDCQFLHYRSISDASIAEDYTRRDEPRGGNEIVKNLKLGDVACSMEVEEVEREKTESIKERLSDNIGSGGNFVNGTVEPAKSTESPIFEDSSSSRLDVSAPAFCPLGKKVVIRETDLEVDLLPVEKCNWFSSIKGCRRGDKCKFRHSNEKEGSESVLCKWYSSEKGCRNAENCAFLHSNGTAVDSGKNVKENKKTVLKVCRWYKSKSGCRKGDECNLLHVDKGTCTWFSMEGSCQNDKCRFSHDKQQVDDQDHESDQEGNIRRDGKNTEQNVNNGSDQTSRKICSFFLLKDCSGKSKAQTIQPGEKSAKQCRYFVTEKGCLNGDRCLFMHNGDIDSLRSREFQQLEKRFKNRFQRFDEGEFGTEYVITFLPTDPDWPFVVVSFDFHVVFPSRYPEQLFTVTLKDDTTKYPAGFVSYLDEELDVWKKETGKRHNGKELQFRPFIRWLDRNLHQMFIRSATKVKLEQDAASKGITLVPHHKIKIEQEEEINNKPEEPTLTSPNGCTTEVIEEVFACVSTSDAPELSDKVKKGTEIKFASMTMGEQVGTLRLSTVALTVECHRCKLRAEYKFKDKSGFSSLCNKCHTNHAVVYYSQIVHQFSPIVGYLHMEGCQAFDLILMDSTVIINCLQCSRDNTVKGMTYGTRKCNYCANCHSALHVEVNTTRFLKLQQPGVVDVKQTNVVKRKVERNTNIKDGEPLPLRGACNHYKKSYRWLRFPCCGKTYSCDVCHDEKEDHEMQYATRMLCGACAKEQPFSQEKPCVRCGASTTRNRSSHWEGGKGCRDRTKMSRGDKRKTAGLNKTVPRGKSESVKK